MTVKELRENVLKCSQSKLAERLGWSRQKYNNKELGKREFKFNEVIEICNLANVDPREIQV